MDWQSVIRRTRLSRGRAVGLGLAAAGIVLLVLALDAQASIDEIGSTNYPLLQDRVSVLEDRRDALLVTSIGAIFLGLFAIALLVEPSTPTMLSASGMVSTAKLGNQMISGFSLLGNATFIPSKRGLTRERTFISAAKDFASPPLAVSDDLVLSPGKDGSTPGILIEPLGLRLLDGMEGELNTKLDNAGIEAAEGTLQMLKHGLGIIRDFHFKERDGNLVLRVEYSGLGDACRTVRRDLPDTCRQFPCIGCSCLLAAAARATGKLVSIEGVDNGKDMVVFTLTLKEW